MCAWWATAGSHGNSSLNLPRSHQTVFHSGCPLLFRKCWEFSHPPRGNSHRKDSGSAPPRLLPAWSLSCNLLPTPPSEGGRKDLRPEELLADPTGTAEVLGEGIPGWNRTETWSVKRGSRWAAENTYWGSASAGFKSLLWNVNDVT